MKIVVLVKEVPDTYGDRTLSLETGLTDRAAGDNVLDEISERALEVALSYADTHPGTEVIVLSMSPASASTNVRRGLAMGADYAVQIVDEELVGADLGLTAAALAAAVQHTGCDLVIAGDQSTDGSGGVLPVMVAEILEVPSATFLSSVEIGESAISGAKVLDGATVQLHADLPAVISITEALPDPRFPTLKNMLSAKKKPFHYLSLTDLAIDPYDPGAARSIVIAVDAMPPRAAGIKVVDEGDAGRLLAQFLVERQLV